MKTAESLASIDTPFGRMLAGTSRAGLCSLRFADHPAPADAALCAALAEWFESGRWPRSHALAPLGTPFQRRVWDEVCRIPRGSVLTYLALAQRIGQPRAVRAVAAALAVNPLLLVVPCHRVIGSDGGLRGYAGGLERKRALLAHEGAWPRAGGRP